MPSQYFPDNSMEKASTAKDRRAQRRKLVKENGIDSPKTRKSWLGNTYPTATEADWTFYTGCELWVHKMEVNIFKASYYRSGISGKWWKADEMLSTGYNYNAHKSELPGWILCELTHHWYKPEDVVEAYINSKDKGKVSKAYRERQYGKCDFTGNEYPRAHLYNIRGSEKYKRVCRSLIDGKQFNTCGRCGNAFENHMVTARQDFGMMMCDACYDIQISGTIIHAHNYNQYPNPVITVKTHWRGEGGVEHKDGPWIFHIGKKFKQVPNPSLRMFGVEVETEIDRKGAIKDGLNRVSLAKNVLKALGGHFAIIKEDGTLTANKHYSEGTGYSGFEIVSAPADLDAHRKHWPYLEQMPGFKHLRAWDEYDTCGFHVHVSRDALDHAQIGRMHAFINYEYNAKFIHRVAGRGSDRFCKYIPKEPGDKTHPVTDIFYVSERVINKDEDNGRNRSRRVALNLVNRHTVEFRIFRGTVHPRHILRNIEFCDAVCDFCAPCTRAYREMENYHLFIAFVDKNRKRWPLLSEWFANQKIIEMKKLGEKAQLDKLTIKPDKAVEVEVSTPKPKPSASVLDSESFTTPPPPPNLLNDFSIPSPPAMNWKTVYFQPGAKKASDPAKPKRAAKPSIFTNAPEVAPDNNF